MAEWVIAIVSGATASVATLAGRIFYERHKERKEEIEQKLEVHFEDLNLNVIEQIAGLSGQVTNQGGLLTYASNVPFQAVHSFEQGDLYTSFELHFSEFARQWKRLKERSVKQNQGVEDFENRIKRELESDNKLPPLRKDSSTEEMIMDITPKLLYQTLCESAQNRSSVYDFTKAQVKLIENLHVLYFPDIAIGVSNVVYTKTIENLEYSRALLVRLQGSQSLKQEVQNIALGGEKLSTEFQAFSSKLYSEIDNISKYELGKRFKRLKSCPICQKF